MGKALLFGLALVGAWDMGCHLLADFGIGEYRWYYGPKQPPASWCAPVKKGQQP